MPAPCSGQEDEQDEELHEERLERTEYAVQLTTRLVER
jgi:hypothetical protein